MKIQEKWGRETVIGWLYIYPLAIIHWGVARWEREVESPALWMCHVLMRIAIFMASQAKETLSREGHTQQNQVVLGSLFATAVEKYFVAERTPLFMI